MRCPARPTFCCPTHPPWVPQLVTDYKAKVEQCTDANSTLTIGSPFSGTRTSADWPWTPIRDTDYGCVATGTPTVSGGAMYWAVFAASSRFPCANVAVSWHCAVC